MIRVVKIGGSLANDASLPAWLDLLCDSGGGRVVVVPGGGPFADQARRSQLRWKFDDVAAHNMAVLAMAQYAFLLGGLCARLVAVRDENAIRSVARDGKVALWIPVALLRSQPDELTTWSVTADSLAAWLATRLRADHLVLVKSCTIPSNGSLDRCASMGIVDASFAQFVRDAPYSVRLLHKSALGTMHRLLVDDATTAISPRDANDVPSS